MIEWEPNKNDANLNIPVDGQVASICWNEQTKLLTMSLAYSAVYGMGERYNGLNQNDRIVKIEVEEKFCNQGDKSYCPSPFFFTDTGFSFCTLSGGTLIFDFTQKNVITVHAPGNCKFIFNAGTPAKLISEYMSLSGPAILPPDWVFGPWISANHWNTQKETEKQIELLKKYQFPATVLVLEAWSDEATFYIFNGAKYREILRNSPVCYSEQEKFLLAEKKINIYRELLQNITSKDLADGAWTVLEKLHAVHIPMAIGSSSKNTPLIVEKLGIGKFFDAIVDGNQISHSKPDPEVFLLAAEKLHQKPSDCLVVEDAEAGVKAALNGGFLVAGIGPAKDCPNVNYPLLSLSELLAVEGHPA